MDIDAKELIAPTYHIYITHLIEYHKPARDRLSEFWHRHWVYKENKQRHNFIFFRPMCEQECTMLLENGVATRNIRDAAEKAGERVPRRKEAYAMAQLTLLARAAVCQALGEYRDGEEFYICSIGTNDNFQATMYTVDEKQVLVEKGQGVDHWQAVCDIREQYIRKNLAKRSMESSVLPRRVQLKTVNMGLAVYNMYMRTVMENLTPSTVRMFKSSLALISCRLVQ
ncbi:hypothetical protein CC80DRAFT_501280 [Byssothecium circinans]|uniref:Uncharacterized protein n=1 Tax=Byssothecium circinans TaxID=147558 RepID=A0A6A5U800_9PLEO|nr:hypothetical protein CC80DRAFT_501280 [Byssothecium circinans]